MDSLMVISHDKNTVSSEQRLLEQRISDYWGTAGCILVNRASDGITLALKASGIEIGDKVLCSPLGNAALIGAIRRSGGEPVFVDVNPNTFTIDPYCAEYVINKFRREKKPAPKALIATDLFGMPCNYPNIEDICTENNISLIVDLHGFLGGAVKEQSITGFGRFVVSSFFENDALGGSGNNGAVFYHTHEDEMLLLDLHSKMAEESILNNNANNMQEVQQLFIGQKLSLFNEACARRRDIASLYKQMLPKSFRVQLERDDYKSTWSQLAVLLPDDDSSQQEDNGAEKKFFDRRTKILHQLAGDSIPASIYCPIPLHKRQSRDWGEVILVNADRVSRRMLLLPMHPYLSRNVVDYICKKLEQIT